MSEPRDLEELVAKMYEAAAHERTVRGDYASSNYQTQTGERPRRWTEVSQLERDEWMAAARVAWRAIGNARLGENTAVTALAVVKQKLCDAVDVALNIKGPTYSDRDEYRGYLNELRAFGEG